MDKLLTAKEVADRLNVKTQTVREWLHAGKIPGTILPSGDMRFNPHLIDAWIHKRTKQPKGLPA